MNIEELHDVDLKKWESILLNLFQNNIPKSKTWINKEDIISVINSFVDNRHLASMYLPYGGNVDLAGSNISDEKDCIEFPLERLAIILKPKKLTFESFGDKYEWDYFRLETSELNPSGVNDPSTSIYEELTELDSNNYVSKDYYYKEFLEYDENGNEVLLPETARLITRIFSGSLVIFAKASMYCHQPENDEGIHNKYSETGFRKYIEDSILRY